MRTHLCAGGWSEGPQASLDVAGFTKDVRHAIFSLLSAVLMLGNLTFTTTDTGEVKVANAKQGWRPRQRSETPACRQRG